MWVHNMVLFLFTLTPMGIYIEYIRDTGRKPRLGDYTNTLDYYTLIPPLKCNVNAMSLHLESWHCALDFKNKKTN